MARTTRKERMERRQVALQKVSNGMGISEVVDFVSSEWGCSRRTARRDCHWALEELQLGLDTHDLAHLISHMATTLQRVSLKAEMSGQYERHWCAAFVRMTYWCLAGWTQTRRKLSATVGGIAAATPALRRQGPCASPTRISLAPLTMRLHPARGGAEPSRSAHRSAHP